MRYEDQVRWKFLKEKTYSVHFVLLSKNSSEFGLLYCFYILFKREAGVG